MWSHEDIAKECEALAKMGYMGVKLFPAQVLLMVLSIPSHIFFAMSILHLIWPRVHTGATDVPRDFWQ
jgi:hypothetical protein